MCRCLLLIVSLMVPLCGQPAIVWGQASPEVEIILDASRSMREAHEGIPRIAAAKQALAHVAHNIPAGTRVALRVFGSQPIGTDARTSCQDSRLLMPMQTLNAPTVAARVYEIGAHGQTPIGYSLQQAMQDFSEESTDRTIILISDGAESCDVDPVVVARTLQEQHIRPIVHTIGLNVDASVRLQLEAIAQLTGGRYADARNAVELGQELITTIDATAMPREARLRLPTQPAAPIRATFDQSAAPAARIPAAPQVEPVVTTFDTDAAGWRVMGDSASTNQTRRGRPDYHAEGGNPGGYISATDNASGATWYWKAPAAYRGDKAAYYGGTLSMDLRQSSRKEQGDNVDLVLQGRHRSLVYDWAENPGTDWTHYAVTLDETEAWYVDDLSGRRATREDVQHTLREVEHLLICGEYETGVDTGGLDNVIMEPTHEISEHD
jgi:hypothetical protein